MQVAVTRAGTSLPADCGFAMAKNLAPFSKKVS
jgi:hypothetical protein